MKTAAVIRRERPVMTRRRVSWVGIAFLSPAIAAFLLFKYIPLAQAVYMSFFDYRVMDPPGTFVGVKNYALLLQSSYFWTALYNTFMFYLLYLLLTFWIPILQALLLNEIRIGNTIYRFFYLVPAATPSIATYILWKWIYHPDYGLLNSWLGKLGLGPYGWLNDPNMAKIAIILPSVLGGGIALLIYYSALQGVSREIVEAAKIDGASPWQRMRYIALPGLRFVIGIQFISFTASIFLAFDQIYVMTGGGPVNSTTVLSMLVFDSAFREYRFGTAGAISMIMFVIIAAITYLQLRFSRGNE
ncbi:carbohydrate ABC transporter permease [Paenibacillus sp. GCM10027626]|uniref:carbohydrate ABC transporter permease n=1 Tax=Paenibacillus sp. GCM10027626 TaxID=3273411 RepID=UPI003645774E